MNKENLIDRVSEILDTTKIEACKAINAITQNIAVALSQEDTVAIAGFGTFSVKHRAARTGRNPKTGETIDIPSVQVPHFKAGSKLKEAVKKSVIDNG